MNCGGRVYKGDSVTISVPFDVSGYTDLTISYSTTGDSKIVKDEDEVTIEDGFISYTFTGDELDLLPDGVIYYTIEYEVDGTDYVASTNTNLYLKTPAGYSGKTAEEIYQDGYEAGLEACSGGTPCNLEEGSVTVTGRIGTYYPTSGYDGFGSVVVDASEYGEQMAAAGYEEGYAQGQEDCPSCDCESAVTEAFQSGYTGGFDEGFMSGSSTTDCSEAAAEAYEIGFSSGYSAGLEDCPECDCSSAVTEAYNSGRQSGYTDGYAQGEEDGHDAGYSEGFDAGFESGQTNCDCESAVTAAYQEGYEDGLEACTGSSCNLQAGSITVVGSTDTFYPDGGYDGFSGVYVDASAYGEQMASVGYENGYAAGELDGFNDGYSSGSTDTWPIAYQSGLTDGFASGQSSCDCSSAITEAFGEGYQSGATDTFPIAYQSGVTDTFPIFYQSGFTDGFVSGQSSCDCSSAYTEGFNSGFQSGITSQSAYTEGLGSIGTLEFTFSGGQINAGLYTQNPVISARMYSGDTFVGRYFFNYSGGSFTHMHDDYSLAEEYERVSFEGYFVGQGLPDPTYLTIRQIGIDVQNRLLNNWVDWTLTIRFNGQPIHTYSGGELESFDGVGSGGFKITPIDVSSTVNGFIQNSKHVIAELDY